MKKENISIIRAKLKDDYVYDAIKKYGYNIHVPYKDKNIVLRILREVWFKAKLPGRRFWYNKKDFRMDASVYVVYDPLIIPDYFRWIKEMNPNARIILSYENRADTTIIPDSVDEFVEKWSYDQDDCKRYNMRFVSPNYFDVYSFDSRKYEKKWDILYLGRDKGRMQQILDYERIFKMQNFRTYFHICADRAYLKYKNRNYGKLLSYKEYLELLKNSNAILNITRQDQMSITQRELEAVFFNIKCITTNKSVKKFELYDETRYFVLGEDNISKLKDFIHIPFKIVGRDLLEKYKYDFVMKKMLNRMGKN